MNLKIFFVGLIIFWMGSVLYAQSNEVIDQVLEQEKLSCKNGAYLALNAGGLIEDDINPEQAFELLQKKGWIKSKRTADDEMSLGEYSLALMKCFSMKGGVLYSIFPSPRYASRELGYKGYISRDSGAYRTLNGSEALSILGQVLRREGQ